jgi:hypothetical protein
MIVTRTDTLWHIIRVPAKYQMLIYISLVLKDKIARIWTFDLLERYYSTVVFRPTRVNKTNKKCAINKNYVVPFSKTVN